MLAHTINFMDSFSQRDAKWANLKLGSSALTVGRFGCTATCIADLSTYFGDDFDPSYAANTIQYTPSGLLIWQSCKFFRFTFDRREYGRHDANIEAALKDPDRAVILQVANASHWVVALNKVLGIYRIADPWFGDRSTMLRYKNNITGTAYFKRI